jgi:D-alanyl-D-alanine carboxypeptidase/D-alanyl-D-alanine-endopeptidase (penicillin-binding protein 4)
VRLSRVVAALVAMLVLVALAAGVATGFFAAAGERTLYATGLWSRGGASTVPPGTFDLPATPASPSSATPAPDVTGLPSPVLPAASAVRALSSAKVAARIAAVDDQEMGGVYSAEVADLGTGKVLYRHRAGTPSIPASTTKLLTSTAALSVLGGDHVFPTTVVRSSASRVVLVGGGDPYLTRSALARLAAETAAELRLTRTTKVALGYDATLFSGPAWHPRWPTAYADQVTPVSALWVDEGRTGGGSPGPRSSNPARDAARAFAAALKKKGITVTATATARAPAKATPLATVPSLPLEQIVQKLLLASDNDAAEVLLRQIALADQRPGSFVEGTKAVRRELARLKLWGADATMVDGSGLARQTHVPAAILVNVLRRAASPVHPELRPVLTGLPVAGVEGSLRIRYVDDQSLAGRGVVRGKTGTLAQVHALAGYLRTADGAQLAFAFLVNGASDDYAARLWLDRVSTALSRCGC